MSRVHSNIKQGDEFKVLLIDASIPQLDLRVQLKFMEPKCLNIKSATETGFDNDSAKANCSPQWAEYSVETCECISDK